MRKAVLSILSTFSPGALVVNDMRVIAGKHRGRPLLGPEGKQTTRPITDRVKQSLFDRLSAQDVVKDAVVLDLFSGTGSMGIECLSRGAAHTTFVERDRIARKRLEENLATFNETGKVLPCDALGGLLLTSIGRTDFSLVFCDPPYRFMTEMPDRVYEQVGRLAEACVSGAVLMLRTPKEIVVPAIKPWGEAESYTYGGMTLHHFTLGG